MRMKEDRVFFDPDGILSLSITAGLEILINGSNLLGSPVKEELLDDRILFHTECGLLTLTSETISHDGLFWSEELKSLQEDTKITRITCIYQPDRPLMMDRFSVSFDFFSGKPELWEEAAQSFHWIPNIKTKPYHIAGHHTFRSPAVIVTAKGFGAALIPDLLSIVEKPEPGRYLDLHFGEPGEDIGAPRLEYGICSNSPDGHVYYKADGKKTPVDESGVSLSFYLLLMKNTPEHKVPGLVAAFHWNKFARIYESKLLPQTVPFAKYAEYGNNMALTLLWQQGPKEDTGGIVLSTFRKSDGTVRGREYADDLWFHCWFNNMRTATELAEFGQREGKSLWVDRAFEIARCLLSSPQKDGIFPTIYAPHDGGWIASSQQGGGKHLFSLPDCAWAALWLRKFIREYGSLQGAEEFLSNFRNFLYRHQNSSGGFPCWVFADTLKHDDRLEDTTAGALPVWFLGEELLSGSVPAEELDKALNAVVRGADFLISHPIREVKFEDFELYYSCSYKPLGYFDEYTKLYGQNTLAIQWCAESLRTAYLLTGKQEYLDAGLFCLNLLSLYQQVWNTPHLDFYTFGGFAVMNTDGEWNDARQAQFAETYMNYYDLTGKPEYFKRAVAAARAGFALMAIEESREVCPRNYAGSPTQRDPHGGSAENYGHGGTNQRSGTSGFHWGTGSALVTAARIKKRYGDLLIDLDSREAFGIDGIVVTKTEFGNQGITLEIETLDEITEFQLTFKSGTSPVPRVYIKGFSVAGEKDGRYLVKRI